MAEPTPVASDLPLVEQAAGWFDRASANLLSEEERQEFERWRENPANRLALAEIEAVHAEARQAAEHPEMLALRHETLSRIVLPHVRRKRRAWLGGAIAASVAAAAIGITTFNSAGDLVSGPPQVAAVDPNLYRTAVGEQLTVSLPDGSSVTLNTASRLRVAYSKTERRLILEAGQALFRVAKGRTRPFVVQALDRVVTAHGTTFDVRIAPDRKVRVALVEGSVSVARVSAPKADPTELEPSQILVASNETVSVSRDPEIDKEVAWRDGLIIFEDDSLAEATAEVNRYVKAPIVLQDERLRQIRVSGAFRTGETGAFVEALQMSFPVRVVERTSDRIVLAYRG
jgi:transmembrane sensor